MVIVNEAEHSFTMTIIVIRYPGKCAYRKRKLHGGTLYRIMKKALMARRRITDRLPQISVFCQREGATG